MKNLAKHTLMSQFVAAAIGVTTLNASAQILEEVVVTATKRAEGLQDVPISISVMSGERITELGITDLASLSVFMPNVHISEASAGDQLFIRGVGSGVNYGFEQSVGTFIDGVYFGRGRSSRSKFLDLERVEVLKGPQSTLFGKNTIAGAINITTRRPGDEFEAYVDAGYRTEFDGYSLEGMVNVPINDDIRARVVARYYDDNGYLDNPLPGEPNGQAREDTTFRAVIDWDVSADLSLSFKAEHGEHNVLGQNHMISKATPTSTGLYRAFGAPEFEAGFDYVRYNKNFTQAFMDQYELPWNPELYDDTTSDLFQLTADWQLGEHTLRSITAYTEYEFTQELDSDYSPLAFINRGRTENFDQISQEFILSSPTGGTVEYMAGLFYQSEEITNNRHTLLGLSTLPPVQQGIFNLIAPITGPLPSGALDGDGLSDFNQNAETLSVFTELTFNVSDTTRVTAGVRYSEDDKDVHKVGRVNNLSGVLPDPLLAVIYGPAVLALSGTYDYKLDRKEDHVTGSLNIQHDLSDATMIYATVSNGYKAGGFDEDNALGNLDAAEFEDETVVSYEIGAKIILADGRGRLNVAYFQSDYSDVQVSTFDGNATFIVGNAAEAEVSGLEADLEYAISDALTMRLAASYLDAKYGSFPGAACNEDQRLAQPQGCTQDLSGQPLQFAPEYSFNVGLRYETAISDGMNLGVSADYNWQDDTVVANDLDPEGIQKAYGKLNAAINLTDKDDKWRVSLIGTNLTDEKTFPWMNDVPLATLGFSKTYFKHIDPPATAELRVRINF